MQGCVYTTERKCRGAGEVFREIRRNESHGRIRNGKRLREGKQISKRKSGRMCIFKGSVGKQVNDWGERMKI